MKRIYSVFWIITHACVGLGTYDLSKSVVAAVGFGIAIANLTTILIGIMEFLRQAGQEPSQTIDAANHTAQIANDGIYTSQSDN